MAEELEKIGRELGEINSFVQDKFNPVTEQVDLLDSEVEKLKDGVAQVQEAQREAKRAQVRKASEGSDGIKVQDGPYAGMDAVDLALIRGVAKDNRGWAEKVDEATQQLVKASEANDLGALEKKFERHPYAKPMLREFSRAIDSNTRALTATGSATGDELVPTLEASALWMDVNLQTQIAPQIPTIAMPSNPFDIPTQLGDVNWYPGTENTTATESTPATAKKTLTAYELVSQVSFSFSIEEDSIIALLPEIRSGLVRNAAEILDDIILNADTTAANNINADGATIATSTAGKGHWLIGYDGLRHACLVDSTGQANNHNAAVSDDMYNEIRSKLDKYGTRPSELVWIMDVNTFIRSQGISNFRTMDKLGPNATILTGQLGAISGIPVIASEQMRLADTDGKVTSAGNSADTGSVLIVNKAQWYQGFRRDMSVDVFRDTQKRSNIVTISFRHALTQRGTLASQTHTGLQYDITGVS
jgi:HK97 family phage major capsid protein